MVRGSCRTIPGSGELDANGCVHHGRAGVTGDARLGASGLVLVGALSFASPSLPSVIGMTDQVIVDCARLLRERGAGRGS
jgi:hypothetical protein